MLSFRYRCSECGRHYAIDPQTLLCPDCCAEQRPREPLRGILEVEITGDPPGPGEWSVFDLLPVEGSWFPSIPVGNTPLWEPQRMRDLLGIPGLYIKDDTLNPTGSLKDRASFLVSAFARSRGITRIVVASTGNAGSSMAGVGAAAGLEVRLYLPASAPAAKLTQAMQYGADVIRVEGSYDDAFAQALAYTREHGGLSRNTGYNPLTIEGKKSVSLEIFQQLRMRSPDYLFLSAGDGVILSGVYKGFEDLVRLGFAEKVPTICMVQAEGSAAISRALETGSFGEPVAAHTIADSISVDVPSAGYFALQRLRNHGGRAIVVSDEAILEAQHRLASLTGLFSEPAAAAAAAGLFEIAEELPRDATVVLLITGSGLKDIDSARKGVGLA
ncbi:MAG: threonine synthase [Alkalispirochaetaceae bacterium]